MLLAASIANRTPAGAPAGANASPPTRRAFFTAGQASLLATPFASVVQVLSVGAAGGGGAPGPPSPPGLAARARLGARSARAKIMRARACPRRFFKANLLCRPTGLAVGLALKELAPPPEGGFAPDTWFPRSPAASAEDSAFLWSDRRQCRRSAGCLLIKRKHFSFASHLDLCRHEGR